MGEWGTDITLGTSGIALSTVKDGGGTDGTDVVLHVVTSDTLGTLSNGGTSIESTGGTTGGTSNTVVLGKTESGFTGSTTNSLTGQIDTILSTVSGSGMGNTIGSSTIGKCGLRKITSLSFVGGGNSVVSVLTGGTSPRISTCGTTSCTRETDIIGPDVTGTTVRGGNSWDIGSKLGRSQS